MLSTSGPMSILSTPVSAHEFRIMAKVATKNIVNPRHETTAALVATISDLPAEGGFLAIKADESVTLLVILPGPQFRNRSGDEITVSDLADCKFTMMEISPA